MSAFIVLFVTNYVKSTSVFIIFLLFQILMGVAHVCLHRALCDNLNLLRLPRHLDHHLQTQQVRSGIFIVIVASFRNLAFYLLFFLEKRQLLEYSELLIPETFRINRGSLNSYIYVQETDITPNPFLEDNFLRRETISFKKTKLTCLKDALA